MHKIHLKSPCNWINDPNGFIYYKGKYHLFYQHFPYAPSWGRMHWGHAVSDDLISWEHLGVALYPTKTNDRSGCFSGSAVEHNGKMYLFYTGVNYTAEDPENINCMPGDSFISSQMLITSSDGFTFDNLKDKKTVVPPLSDPSVGSLANTRDPKVWRGKNAWYMIVGSTSGNTGRFLFFRSDDLENWSYVNHYEKNDLGWMWECPDYFETDNTGVIVFSPIGILDDNMIYDSASVCMTAHFDEDTCTMTTSGNVQMFDYGIDLYAPQSTQDSEGRRIITAWTRMPEPVDGKWSGMMCIPRTVEVRNGHIYFRPHPSVRNAFVNKVSSLSFSPCSMIRTSLKNSEYINIGGYEIKRENNTIITDRSSVYPAVKGARLTAVTPEIHEGYELEIYADRNLIEIYINNGEYVLSSVVYGLKNTLSGKECTILRML